MKQNLHMNIIMHLIFVFIDKIHIIYICLYCYSMHSVYIYLIFFFSLNHYILTA